MVESTSLLTRRAVKGSEGSNPSVSAKIGNLHLNPKWGRAEGATLMHSPKKTLNQKGFSTLRVEGWGKHKELTTNTAEATERTQSNTEQAPQVKIPVFRSQE